MPDSIMQQLEAATRATKSASETAFMRQNSPAIQPTQQKAITSTDAQYAHGPSGLFNQPGVDQGVFSTIIRPVGLSPRIPFIASVDQTPLFEALQGQLASSGSEPQFECGTPIAAGQLKRFIQTAPFGRLIRKTDNINLNRFGQMVNSAEPMDLRVVNDIGSQSKFLPDPAKTADVLNSEIGLQYWRFGLEVERVLEGQLFTGSPATTYATDSGYKEMAGLAALVNTGKIDALNGMPVPAADSLVVNWNNALITGTTTLAGQSADIVTTLSSMYNYLQSKANRTGIGSTRWVIAMRYDVWYELTRIWPCSYLTNRCTSAVLNGATQFVQGSEQVAMRDEMFNGQFLWINGQKVEVVWTDGIPETAVGNGTKSDIYFLPMSAGGRLTLYAHYFDFSNAQINQALNSVIGNQFTVSNGGMYLWTFQRDGYCFYLEGKIESRLVLRTSWLAARLSNVVINTPIHTIDGYTTSVYPSSTAGGSTVGTFGNGVYGQAY